MRVKGREGVRVKGCEGVRVKGCEGVRVQRCKSTIVSIYEGTVHGTGRWQGHMIRVHDTCTCGQGYMTHIHVKGTQQG